MTSNPTKIRILHVITALSTGGAEMMLLRLLSATKETHCHAVVSLKDEGTIGPQIKALGVPVYALRLHPLLLDPIRAFSIRSLARQFRPHLIQGWMYHGNLMASFAARAWHERPPVVWGVHQSVRKVSDYGRRTALAIRLGALFSRGPAKIIYVSRTGAMQHESLGYDSGRQIVIPNGIDCQVFRPDDSARQDVRAELGLAPETVLIGLAARYHPMKNHVGFLKAASRVIQKHPSVCFLLFGEGVTSDQPALQGIIRQFHLQDCVFLLGERRDMPRLIAALDIACSASAWGEAFSLAIGEAMACGVPCVVTDIGDSVHIVGGTGLSCPPGDSEALAQAIEQLIDSGPEHRRQLGVAARQRVESQFSLPLVAHRYEDLYQQLLPEAVQSAILNGLATTTKKANR